MGCIGARDRKNYERILNEMDNDLKFQELNLENIKTVVYLFFIYNSHF